MGSKSGLFTGYGGVTAMPTEMTVHTMPLDALRARAREARRLLEQAREIARANLGDGSDLQAPPSSEETHPSRRVGVLLDAAQRLLPGMPLAEDRAASGPLGRLSSRPLFRAKPPESGQRRVTLRGGEERALESIERAEILDGIAGDAAMLIAEIERRSSSMLRAAESS
jgi:hypothetical protein